MTTAPAPCASQMELRPALLVDTYGRTSQRLLVFNLEGVLAKPVALPELLEVQPKVLVALRHLAAAPGNTVVVTSQRSRDTMEAMLGHIPDLCLSAEHGIYLRWKADRTAQHSACDAGGDDGSSGGGGEASVVPEWECTAERIDMSWERYGGLLFEPSLEALDGA